MFQDYMGWKGFLPAYGSGGWTEIAVLLCITENPGINCCPDQNLCVVLDHLEASLSGNRLTVKNILDYPVRVRLMAENGKAQKEVTDPLAWLHYRTIELAPFEMAVVDLQ